MTSTHLNFKGVVLKLVWYQHLFLMSSLPEWLRWKMPFREGGKVSKNSEYVGSSKGEVREEGAGYTLGKIL